MDKVLFSTRSTHPIVCFVHVVVVVDVRFEVGRVIGGVSSHVLLVQHLLGVKGPGRAKSYDGRPNLCCNIDVRSPLTWSIPRRSTPRPSPRIGLPRRLGTRAG